MILTTLLAAVSLASPSMNAGPGNIFQFKMKSIDGKVLPLESYKGRVLLVVNVASQCGLTPQYASLENLYRAKKAAGLVVLGFPANEFGNQEPGTNEEIKAFCSGKYDVTFPMFAKIVVKGQGIHPLYQWLTENTGGKEIEWNFAKFLVGRDGTILKRFEPRTKPDSPEFLKALDDALAVKP